MRDLIVLIPDHCLSIYSVSCPLKVQECIQTELLQMCALSAFRIQTVLGSVIVQPSKVIDLDQRYMIDTAFNLYVHKYVAKYSISFWLC